MSDKKRSDKTRSDKTGFEKSGSDSVEKGKDYRSYLSKDEMKILKQSSNSKAFLMFAFNWGVIAAAFSLVMFFPNVLTVIVALFILAGRQLGLGILLHECSHRSFFADQRYNDLVGHWLGGMPILVPMTFYRPYHFKHHTRTGTQDDPDVGNIKQYPVSKQSFKRKVLRDFSGMSGLKMIAAVFLYVLPQRAGNAVSLGISAEDETAKPASLRVAATNYSNALLFHVVFFSVFYLLGHPMLYMLWWVAYLFVHPFIIRVRQIGEHGAMPALESGDVRDNTRTTIAGPLERLIFAPNFVNYHCEHHYMPTVPSYNLAKMHRLLKSRGFYEDKQDACVENGYLGVIRKAIAV